MIPSLGSSVRSKKRQDAAIHHHHHHNPHSHHSHHPSATATTLFSAPKRVCTSPASVLAAVQPTELAQSSLASPPNVSIDRPEVLDADAKKAWAAAFEVPEFKDLPIANVVMSMQLTPGATRLFSPEKLSNEHVVDFSVQRIGSTPTMGRFMQNMHQLKIIKPEPWGGRTRKGPRVWALKLGATSESVHITGVKKYEEVAFLLDYLVDLLKVMAGNNEELPPIRVSNFCVGNLHASFNMYEQQKNMRLSLDDVCADLSTGIVIQHPDPHKQLSFELTPTTKAVVNAVYSEKQHKTYTGFTFTAKVTSCDTVEVGTSSVTIFGSGSLLINGKSAPLIAVVADMMTQSYLPPFVKQEETS